MTERAPDTESRSTNQPRSYTREILGLAIPAFATLVSEPLLVLADSAIIGHLSTSALAGLGIAANVLSLSIGLCIFLAYGTTATVARRLGAGDRAGALAGGLDGMSLGVVLGIILGLILGFGAPGIVGLYGADPVVSQNAVHYLAISAIGLPAVMVMLSSTGVLRGLQDTRTPLYVAVTANLLNIGLNITLVYGVGMGIAGSATGSVIAQYASAAVLSAVVLRGARREGVHWRWHPGGVLQAARSSGWLVIRSACLQVALTITTRVAAGMGVVAMASHQIINALWMLLAFALDAIAIAAQAIIGRYLGAGDVPRVRQMTALMIRWGAIGGLLTGILMWAAHSLYAPLFTPDPAVHAQLGRTLLVVAVVTWISGIVYVLDGVLIGAGDLRYLALAGVIALACYVPLALTVALTDAGLTWLWVAYSGYMLARMATLVLRALGTAWQRVGA